MHHLPPWVLESHTEDLKFLVKNIISVCFSPLIMYKYNYFRTRETLFSLNRPLGWLSLDVPVSACLYVCLSVPLLSPLNKMPDIKLKITQLDVFIEY